jgi:hypothetical protein
LHAGDELTIGNHRFRVSWDPPVGPVPRPVPMRSVHEPDLESCDEPVPLQEPSRRPVPLALAQDPPVALVDQLESSHRSSRRRRPPSPIVLPEDLKLAPLSDSQPSPLPDPPPAPNP